jgi:hypothetical protein
MPPPDRFPVAYATFVRHDLSEQTEAFRYGSDRAERPKVGDFCPSAFSHQQRTVGSQAFRSRRTRRNGLRWWRTDRRLSGGPVAIADIAGPLLFLKGSINGNEKSCSKLDGSENRDGELVIDIA